MKTALKAQAQDWFPTRYSLLSRLQNWDDQESWKDFFNTYWRLIYSVALKSGLTEQEAQETVQETVISVAKGIHTFKRDRTLGSFKNWLGNIIRWRIIDQLRKREPSPLLHIYRDSTMDEADPLGIQQLPDPAGADPEALWDEEWRTNLFDAAVERVKQQVREEHYQIFYLYTFKQWPVGKVADALGVSAAQVYLVKHRISALIKKEVRSLEKKLF
jgi:RNA polymerase sigma factor (sigma-70 family)